MKKLLTALIIVLIVLALAISVISIKLISSSEQKQTQKEYSYTKAICDKDNFCQDTVIVCNGNQIISTDPITGAAVKYPQSWRHPRTTETIKTFCWN